jgi:TRAP-type C4-dicarboxylate transport system permease small subunit
MEKRAAARARRPAASGFRRRRKEEDMAQKLERIVQGLMIVEFWIVAPLFLLMLALMFIQVIFRYVLESPLPWSEELCRYLFIITAFMGGAVATGERSHIEINFVELFIVKSTQDPMKRHKRGLAMNILRDGVTILVAAVIVYESWKYVLDAIYFDQISVAMEMPMWVLSGSILLALILIGVHSILNIILNISGRGPTGYSFEEGKA